MKLVPFNIPYRLISKLDEIDPYVIPAAIIIQFIMPFPYSPTGKKIVTCISEGNIYKFIIMAILIKKKEILFFFANEPCPKFVGHPFAPWPFTSIITNNSELLTTYEEYDIGYRTFFEFAYESLVGPLEDV